MKDNVGVDFPVKSYEVLLKAVVIPEVTKGGIYLTDSIRSLEKRKYNIGLVLKLGEEAYADKSRFPKGPRCKVGDWVHFKQYEKQDEYINDHLCYVVSDERIWSTFTCEDLPSIIPELRDRGESAAPKS